ncbi:MAG: outer membrane beta-barrel protein [Coxiellaceae bacterium]|nr:MAG: outer membrane beta-barrel protein [Coxiellaceae bacterium]
MLHKAKYLLLGTTLFTFSTLAFADNSGFSPSPDFYVGLQMGYADTNWDWVMDTDDSGLAGSVLVGYELNQYFSIETGYVILPQSTYDVNF